MKMSLFLLFPLGHLGLALVEWLLLGWAIRLWRSSPSLAMMIMPVVLLSLSYDNLVLAIGSWFGAGDLLKTLSLVRFFLHDLVVPLFIVIGVELAQRAGAAWANRTIRTLSWVVAFAVAGIDISTNDIGLVLVPTNFLGMVRYISAIAAPPIATIVVTGFVLVVGTMLWVRLKWMWLCVGTAIALIGNAMPSSIVGPLPGSTAELIMALSLLLTEQRTQSIHRQLDLGEQNHNVESWISVI